MFKRLTKARRHSADEIGGVLPSPLTLDEPPGAAAARKNAEAHQQSGVGAYVFGPRSKFSRKSCGDAYALLGQDEDEPQSPAGKQQQSEADYRVVTAVPAFIVEHEPEKQRGTFLRRTTTPFHALFAGRGAP